MTKIQTENMLHSLTSVSASAYLSFIEAIKVRTVDWASDGKIKKLTEEIVKSGSEDAVAELSDYLKKEKILYDPSVKIIDILDKNGVVIASSRQDRIGLDEGLEEIRNKSLRYNEAIRSESKEVFVTSATVIEQDEYLESMIRATTRLFVLNPENGNEESIDAIMLMHFAKSNDLANVLFGGENDSPLNFYKTAEIYMVNRDRLFVSNSRFVQDAFLKLHNETELVIDCFDNGKDGIKEYVNYFGEKVFGSSSCLQKDGLVIIAETQSMEIANVLKGAGGNIFGSIFAALIVAIGGSLFLARNFYRRLNLIAKKAKEIADNNFNVRFPVETKDELGNISFAFNNMLEGVEVIKQDLKEKESHFTKLVLSLEKELREKIKDFEKIKKEQQDILETRTAEMKEKIKELEMFKKLSFGRELLILELKKEVESLKNKFNQ
ncbi:MAG: HAMP domain-containing protein [bacterium]|nr:HAMP domain-containing protein [bacterium]